MMKGLVIGYYGSNNLGDESYKDVIPNFFPSSWKLIFQSCDKILQNKNYFRSENIHTLEFVEYLREFNFIIVGGGDIINNYFRDKLDIILPVFKSLRKKIVIAFSIGIPFPQLLLEQYFKNFDHVFCRNLEDIRSLQKVIGERAHYIPEVCLSLGGNSTVKNKNCGVFLVGNIDRYPNITNDITELMKKIRKDFDITFYCFNPEDENISKFVYNNIKKESLFSVIRNRTKVNLDTKYYNLEEMLEIIRNLSLAVCMRYHSHIFALASKVPILSISSTRKTASIMKQANLEFCQYQIELDSCSNPVKSNSKEMKNVYKNVINNGKKIRENTSIFIEKCNLLFKSQQWVNLIKDSCNSVNRQVKNILKNGDKHSVQSASMLISKKALDYPDSKAIWGLSEKLEAVKSNINNDIKDIVKDSINYMIGEISLKLDIKKEEKDIKLPINVDIKELTSYKDAHRGGWFMAISELYNRTDDKGVIFDMYLDRTFHWAKKYLISLGKLPYSAPWCGFVHHTFEKDYSPYNLSNMFEDEIFLMSLHHCYALFTLSESLAKKVRNKLKELNFDIKVYSFDHPMCEDYVLFNFENVMKKYNDHVKIPVVNVGYWLRNPLPIYTSFFPKIFSKHLLLARDGKDYAPPKNIKVVENVEIQTDKSQNFSQCLINIGPCRDNTKHHWINFLVKWLEKQNTKVVYYKQIGEDSFEICLEKNANFWQKTINNMIKEVEIIEHLSNEDYDILLSNSVIFLNLIDSASSNTILECVVRNTPILVNKLEGVVDLLGEKYPLYYEKENDIYKVLTIENIINAHFYMRKMNKNKYKIETFIKEITEVVKDF